MTQFLFDYGLFLLKVLTVVIFFMLTFVAIAAIRKGGKALQEDELGIQSLNEHFSARKEQLLEEILDEKTLKARRKAAKKEKKDDNESKPRLFVLDFDGDIEASAVENLREHISCILLVAEKNDRVLLRLESGGGLVHAYGLAASQLARLREKNIFLTIAVDKVAASGGYMMACLADELIAAPFAILGSVGVIGALPNFHDLLERHHVHYEQHTAGEHKRTLTVFGENTDADREQFRHELQITHQLFKEHILRYRPQLEMEKIATGETWYGSQCLENQLIDKISTSDDFILAHLESHQILHLAEEEQESFAERLKSRFFGKIDLARPFKMFIR